MLLPKPVPGLVIRYSYLWYREYCVGREEGSKDRPCAPVAALIDPGHGATRVLVLPITHAPPNDPATAVELPIAVKTRLGLDAAPAWVILTEWNEFKWPGPDLRRIPGGGETTVAYGMLPPGLFAKIRDRFIETIKTRKAEHTVRT